MKGSMVALVTPFKNNEIDYNALEKLIDFHIENKTDVIVLLGTTAETATLANDEKESLLRFATQRLKGKIPYIIGTGTNNVSQTLLNTARAKYYEAEAALIVTPYYNKPTQEGIYQYYSHLAKNVDIPIIMYNVPGRTGCNQSAETTIKLAKEFPNKIIGIKEASGNIVQAGKIIKDAPAGFFLLSGEDAINYPLMCIGAQGCISVTANIVPLKMRNLIHAALDNNHAEARKIHLELLELNQNMFIETNPIPVKNALSMMGLISNELRLPLCDLEPQNFIKLEKCLKDNNLI
ncbi:MAG: 4-hydroxy-tetrahydrodipicolinate synthase [Candidatus Cloacimonadales bacterium]|jgi:4-hydroxy-tetrahydrodipicolinate synthase|nr:4-hydroxy-tetrahydrodipicolinate synthase [Candidatus Cloacimonadota bacterium]MDD2649513.1 4-hydroxy-tetrahydrodipicolinate synthase [Candidatus Cloacimonadota bacterium]MDX9977557.1 4-hydroxy-tetrahydrodipicolinate synthase [Candidatus Cloacimonadales bacterium]